LKGAIEKDGKDLVITLSQEILDDAGIKIGDDVDVSVNDGKILIVRKETPVHPAV
jgi:antitoxin component of MazEF toxin-antitoxin module